MNASADQKATEMSALQSNLDTMPLRNYAVVYAARTLPFAVRLVLCLTSL